MVTVPAIALFGTCRIAGECLPSCGLCAEAWANTDPYGTRDYLTKESLLEDELFALPPLEPISTCPHLNRRISIWKATICTDCGEDLDAR